MEEIDAFMIKELVNTSSICWLIADKIEDEDIKKSLQTVADRLNDALNEYLTLFERK